MNGLKVSRRPSERQGGVAQPWLTDAQPTSPLCLPHWLPQLASTEATCILLHFRRRLLLAHHQVARGHAAVARLDARCSCVASHDHSLLNAFGRSHGASVDCICTMVDCTRDYFHRSAHCVRRSVHGRPESCDSGTGEARHHRLAHVGKVEPRARGGRSQLHDEHGTIDSSALHLQPGDGREGHLRLKRVLREPGEVCTAIH
mmetsp:Transcript_12067/g.27557  ORF Transcript_12067/g.27557 Transcript_12067/m.27557 type:complete len:202 (-) Transcript_12067:307-912(-)